MAVRPPSGSEPTAMGFKIGQRPSTAEATPSAEASRRLRPSASAPVESWLISALAELSRKTLPTVKVDIQMTGYVNGFPAKVPTAEAKTLARKTKASKAASII